MLLSKKKMKARIDLFSPFSSETIITIHSRIPVKSFNIKTLCLTAILSSGSAFGMDQTPTDAFQRLVLNTPTSSPERPRTVLFHTAYSPEQIPVQRQLQFGDSPAHSAPVMDAFQRLVLHTPTSSSEFPRTLYSPEHNRAQRQLQFGDAPAHPTQVMLNPSTRALRWATAIPVVTQPSAAIYDPSTRALRWATAIPVVTQPAVFISIVTPQPSVNAVNASPISSEQAWAKYQELRERQFARAGQQAVANFNNVFFTRMLAPILNAPARPVRPAGMNDEEYYEYLRNLHYNNK
jgi:hypothetical protein